MFLIVTGLAAVSMFCVWNNLQVRKLQYEIAETQKELRRARRSYKQVWVRYEKRRSPVRLRKMMEKRKINLISSSRAGAHRLTPYQMKQVIHQRRLVSGTKRQLTSYQLGPEQ